MPMSAVGYLMCVIQERHGVKLKYRHTTDQARAILDHMKEAMSDNA